MIDRGNLYISSRKDAANKLLGKALKVRLGRGFYGECLVRLSPSGRNVYCFFRILNYDAPIFAIELSFS